VTKTKVSIQLQYNVKRTILFLLLLIRILSSNFGHGMTFNCIYCEQFGELWLCRTSYFLLLTIKLFREFRRWVPGKISRSTWALELLQYVVVLEYFVNYCTRSTSKNYILAMTSDKTFSTMYWVTARSVIETLLHKQGLMYSTRRNFN